MFHVFSYIVIALCSVVLLPVALPQEYNEWSSSWITTTAEPLQIRIRLVGGSTKSEGRLVVYHQSSWGSVCLDGFGITEAEVVCRQLGYDSPFDVVDGAKYRGPQNYVLSYANCYGTEKSLDECRDLYWDTYCRTPYKSVGIRCFTERDPFVIRLRDGPNLLEGRLEVKHEGQWGTVCDSEFGMHEANVVCRQLNHDFALEVKGGAFYGEGIFDIILDGIDCHGEETSLSRCWISKWGRPNSCNRNQAVGVRCVDGKQKEIPIQLVRNIGSSYESVGYVKASFNGSLGYICPLENWGLKEAKVACRQLGYTHGAVSTNMGPYWQILNDEFYVISVVSCTGEEDNLAQCNVKGVEVKESGVISPTDYPWQTDNPRKGCGNDYGKPAGVFCNPGLSVVQIVAITAACVLFTVMLITVPVLILRCKKHEDPTEISDGETVANRGSSQTQPISGTQSEISQQAPTIQSGLSTAYHSPALAYRPITQQSINVYQPLHTTYPTPDAPAGVSTANLQDSTDNNTTQAESPHVDITDQAPLI